MKNSMVIFIFLFFTGNILFFGNFFQKLKLFVEAKIKNVDLFEYVEFDGNLQFFFYFVVYSFSVNLVNRFKTVRLRWNLIPRLIWIQYVKLYGDTNFFYFKPFLKVLFKNQFGILMFPD